MKRLVDRHAELTALRERMSRDASMALVYGPRRVGKTFMLQHLFLPDGVDAPVLFFVADESTSEALLERFCQVVSQSGQGGPLWDSMKLGDWSTALSVLAQSAQSAGRPLTLVFDEVQYLLASEPAFASVIQRIWDELHARHPLHIVLCGSALGTMASLGDVGQPLHGRFDLRLKVRPFGYREAAMFAPGWSSREAFELYGVFGGLARHLAEVSVDAPLGDNVVRAILDPLGALHEAPLDLLRTERLSVPAHANALLAAVAAGEERFNSMASRTGLTASRLDHALKELQDLEVIRRESRFGDHSGARYARYRCVDPFMRFWFRLVQPQRGALLGTTPDAIWRERVAPRVSDHMGAVFEDVVRQAFEGGVLQGELGPVDRVAPFWSRDGATDIDWIAQAGSTRVYVECKWRPDGVVDLRDLERLRAHAGRYPRHGDGTPTRLCLATAGTFAEPLRRVAEADGTLLLGPNELLA